MHPFRTHPHLNCLLVGPKSSLSLGQGDAQAAVFCLSLLQQLRQGRALVCQLLLQRLSLLPGSCQLLLLDLTHRECVV